MNPNLNTLHPYPFEKLNALKAGITPPKDKKHIALSIGEPKHAPPESVKHTLRETTDKIANYAATKGGDALRNTLANWLTQRFNLTPTSLDGNKHVLPVNGTREAIFAFVQTVINPHEDSSVISPNPFYQIYEGAALLASSNLYFTNCDAKNNFLPDLDNIPEEELKRCQLFFICTPGNPSGAVMPLESLQKLIFLADKYDFIIASDECYSEIYFDENCPPPGLLQACQTLGRNDYARCVVFHSLSKRSNLPGLRSGMVAGDETLIQQFLKYRTYHGCAMPLHNQMASIVAWEDESHVLNNRDAYREKFDAVITLLKPVIDIQKPQAGFYLWLKTPINDADFAQQLFATENVTVLPGSFLARETQHGNPGQGYVRIALVAGLDECIEAANRIKRFISKISSI